MTKKKKPKPIGPVNPESGGGEGGKTRSPAEQGFRDKFDEQEKNKGKVRRPGTEPGTY